MATSIAEWQMDVQRGPGWLLVKPSKPDLDLSDHYPLADRLWSLMERHFVYRVLVELDDIQLLNSHLIAQLLLLHRRTRDHEGVMRLCGLSQQNRFVLQTHGLLDRFPTYESVKEAVHGGDPIKPKPR